jgi:hypothetical protein
MIAGRLYSNGDPMNVSPILFSILLVFSSSLFASEDAIRDRIAERIHAGDLDAAYLLVDNGIPLAQAMGQGEEPVVQLAWLPSPESGCPALMNPYTYAWAPGPECKSWVEARRRSDRICSKYGGRTVMLPKLGFGCKCMMGTFFCL